MLSKHKIRPRRKYANQLIEGQPGPIGLFDIPQSDMSWALFMESDDPLDPPQVYQGWYDDDFARLIPLSTFSKFTIDEWTKLKEENLTLNDAIVYADGEAIADGQFAENPKEHYRLKGHGFLTEI